MLIVKIVKIKCKIYKNEFYLKIFHYFLKKLIIYNICLFDCGYSYIYEKFTEIYLILIFISVIVFIKIYIGNFILLINIITPLLKEILK